MEASTPKYRTATPSATRSRIREMKGSSMFSTTPAVVCSASEATAAPCGSISGEPVELVARHVQQERVGGAHGRREPQRVGLVELEDGHVGLEAPVDRQLADIER